MRLFSVTTQTRRQHERLTADRAHMHVTISFVFLQGVLRHKLLPAMLTRVQQQLTPSAMVFAHVALKVRLTLERLLT